MWGVLLHKAYVPFESPVSPVSSPVLIMSLIDPRVPSTLSYFRISNKRDLPHHRAFARTVPSVCSPPPFLASILKGPVPGCAKSLQCPTLCGPMDCDQPGSSIHGIPQEYWSGLPFASPGNLPHPGIQPVSLRSNLQWRVGSLPLAVLGKPKK